MEQFSYFLRILHFFILKRLDIGYGVFSLLTLADDFFIYDELRLFPYIYLYVMLMMALSPTIYHHLNPPERIEPPRTRVLLVPCVIVIVCGFLQLPGLNVLERHPHGASGAAYLPHGVDASSGDLNFRFSNGYDFPIRIEASCHDLCLFIAIYREDGA